MLQLQGPGGVITAPGLPPPLHLWLRSTRSFGTRVSQRWGGAGKRRFIAAGLGEPGERSAQPLQAGEPGARAPGLEFPVCPARPGSSRATLPRAQPGLARAAGPRTQRSLALSRILSGRAQQPRAVEPAVGQKAAQSGRLQEKGLYFQCSALSRLFLWRRCQQPEELRPGFSELV